MRLYRVPNLLVTLLVLLTLLSACGASEATVAPTAEPPTPIAEATSGPAPTTDDTADMADRLRVVATYSILGDMVQNVGGDLIDLAVLVGAGSDPHVYEPVPADNVTLSQATLIFENGLEFETWLDRLYTASGSQATRVDVSKGIDLIRAEDHDHDADADHSHDADADHSHDADADHSHDADTDHSHDADADHSHDADADHSHDADHDHGHGHTHGEYDPHIWHSVANARIMVQNITAALVAADPDNAATYEANATAYLGELGKLESFIQQEVAQLPAERRKLVTTHDTFGYFARDYGFEVVGTALGITTEAADPSAGEIAALVAEIQAAGVPAIFAENIANPRLMETIAQEAGVEIGPMLFTDALGEPGSAGETYIDMMRYNVTAIVTALQE